MGLHHPAGQVNGWLAKKYTPEAYRSKNERESDRPGRDATSLTQDEDFDKASLLYPSKKQIPSTSDEVERMASVK